MSKGYLLNTAAKTIHNLEHLSEECNTDDIAEGHKEYLAEVDLQALRFSGYEPCEHCRPKEEATA